MYSVVTEEDLKAIDERNKERVREAIKAMGEKYLCHPKHYVKPKKQNERQAN